ncbi:MAG: hypothetical protein KBS57_00275, partial [Alistipes sp.]|nr:hypothetical protein [Candidatus Minthomonas equi]
YLLVVGEKEVEGNLVSLRKQGEGDKGQMTVETFISHISEEIEKMIN